MKQWEDIFKEKLEDYESGLPEGSLEDFRARLEESRKPSGKRRGILPWLIAAVSASAASLVLLIPVRSDFPSQRDNTVAEVASVESDTSGLLAELPQDEPLVPAAASGPSSASAGPVRTNPSVGVTFAAEEAAKDESAFETKESDTTGKAIGEEPVDEYSKTTEEEVGLPSFPGPAVSNPSAKSPVRINVRAGSVASGLVGASAIGGALASVGAFKPTHTSLKEDDDSPSHGVVRDPILDTTYRVPVKVGVGFRYAVTERLYVSSGVGYSQYATDYNFTYRGKVSQIARYISVPLRVDYGVFQSRWVDAYLGVGGAADFCVHASVDGEELAKEGTTFSLVGAAGLQVNITKHIGAFVEPQVSWAIPSEKRVLETYRYMHPVALDVSTGIRFTFGKR